MNNFCPKCSYNLNIQKNTTNQDTRNSISIIEAFEILNNNKNMNLYKANFEKSDIIKNKKYQKLSEEDKIKLNQLFEEIVSSGAEFKCESCNFTKQITETTLLYQINLENKINQIKSLEENELTVKDPLLPHTRDYTCKNPSCITHKNQDSKDAVFFRDKGSYKMNYICSVCFYNW